MRWTEDQGETIEEQGGAAWAELLELLRTRRGVWLELTEADRDELNPAFCSWLGVLLRADREGLEHRSTTDGRYLVRMPERLPTWRERLQLHLTAWGRGYRTPVEARRLER
jgi:hypothetical protein